MSRPNCEYTGNNVIEMNTKITQNTVKNQWYYNSNIHDTTVCVLY